jgi:hypothetical protein
MTSEGRAKAIDRCACGGKLVIVSLDRQERIRRRLGRSWLARCERCGAETAVDSQAWRENMRAGWERKKAAARQEWLRVQPSLF